MLFNIILMLFLLMLLGFIAAKIFSLNVETLSKILIYFIAPLVFIEQLQGASINYSLIGIFFLVFFISSCSSIIIYWVGSIVFSKKVDQYITAFAIGTGNTGYFGLPIAIALLSQHGLLIYMFGLLGMVIYESTLGYYYISKSHLTWKKALLKVLSLPMIYAFAIGIFINIASIPEPIFFKKFLVSLKSTYSVLGMMLIGISIAKVKLHHFDIRYLLFNLINRYAVFPFITIMTCYGLSVILSMPFRYFIPVVLISIMPVAGNVVILSQSQRIESEKAALLTLISTFMAIVIIPLYRHLLQF